MNEKNRERESNRLIIKSFRSVDRWVSYDVINIYEEAFTKIDPSISISNIGKIPYFIRRILINRYVRSNKLTEIIYKGIQKILSENYDESIFMTCLSAVLIDILGFYNSKGVKIAYIVDAWENSIEYIAANIDTVDIVLMAFQDSIDLLKKYIPPGLMKKIYLYPVFIDPLVYPKKSPNKLYDIIQVGRRNDILHQWAIKYSNEKKHSYIFQKRNQRGMYYLEDRDWEAENYQFSYQSLVKVLSQSKIALVSPPDRADSKRTGRISPLTHRYLEAAMCQAVTVGYTPTSGEYALHFPKDFTIVPKDYGEFEEICDRLIDKNDLRTEISRKNRNYVIENHSVTVRYRQLQEIIMDNRNNKTEQISKRYGKI
jgi:spore maturation protein CgeB